MNRIRLAVIGAGAIGRKHIEVIQQTPEAELVALADPSPQAQALAASLGLAWYADINNMLDRANPQGVINATPNTLHVPCTIACVERGIPVLVEKPVAESPERAQLEHEATTSRIGEDQLFYCLQRGISEEDAISMIVNGFCKDVFSELPLEFAVEAQKLLAISLEHSVG